jgi:hypothetical protein
MSSFVVGILEFDELDSTRSLVNTAAQEPYEARLLAVQRKCPLGEEQVESDGGRGWAICHEYARWKIVCISNILLVCRYFCIQQYSCKL